MAERCWEHFDTYTNFRKIQCTDKLELFKLLMTDQASDWLRSLPDDIKQNFELLLQEFKKRHALSRVDKWKKNNRYLVAQTRTE